MDKFAGIVRVEGELLELQTYLTDIEKKINER
jgi:hypothetical protein